MTKLTLFSAREASIELVQTLVLKAAYASGVGGDVAAAWSLIGSALRTAQDLGLHVRRHERCAS